MRISSTFQAVGALIGLALSGCSGSSGPSLGADEPKGVGTSIASLGGVTSYVAANAMITTGYSDRELAADHFEVRAKGTTVTPPERLEKIALARAAEIGVEQQFKFFKIGPYTHAVLCKDAKDATHKGGRVTAERAPVVAIDVIYAKEPLDPSYLPTAETFERVQQELTQGTPSQEMMTESAAAAQAKCGK